MTKTLAVDFDGVIHAYSKGWHDGTIYDHPLPGAIDGLRALMRRYAVIVHTTRDVWDVQRWLKGHHVPAFAEGAQLASERTFWDCQDVVLVTRRKYPALAYIDDRAHLFRDWPDVMATFIGGGKDEQVERDEQVDQ